MLQLDIQISFGALAEVIHVILVRRRHRENVAADGLGVNGAATTRQCLGQPHIRSVVGSGCRESWGFEKSVVGGGGGGNWERGISSAVHGEDAEKLRRIHVLDGAK